VRIAATISTPEEAELVRDLGSEGAMCYHKGIFVAAVHDWTDGRGVDVALYNVGPQLLQRTFVAVAPNGRMVTLMGTPAYDGELNAYNRNLTIHKVMRQGSGCRVGTTHAATFHRSPVHRGCVEMFPSRVIRCNVEKAAVVPPDTWSKNGRNGMTAGPREADS
jgi:NADPH2:quinone reductase